VKIAERIRLEWLALAVVMLATAAVALAPHHEKRRVVVVDTSVEILDHVTFVGDTISTRSLRVLDAIADTLEGNPAIALVEVQATTTARAQACVDYLVGQGIAPERLVTGLSRDHDTAFLIVTRRD
jgi:hypothetical protein